MKMRVNTQHNLEPSYSFFTPRIVTIGLLVTLFYKYVILSLKSEESISRSWASNRIYHTRFSVLLISYIAILGLSVVYQNAKKSQELYNKVLRYNRLNSQFSEEGISLCRTAANAGNADALFHLWNTGYKGLEGNPQAYLRKAAENGHVEAMYQLGILLEKSNIYEAIHFLSQAASHEHPGAMYKIGKYRFSSPHLMAITEEHAVALLEKASNKGNGEAMFELGYYHHKKSNLKIALEWYEKGTLYGSGEAFVAVGEVNHLKYKDQLKSPKCWEAKITKYLERAKNEDLIAISKLGWLAKIKLADARLQTLIYWYKKGKEIYEAAGAMDAAKYLETYLI